MCSLGFYKLHWPGGAQILRARSSGRLDFAWWRLAFGSNQQRTCFISPYNFDADPRFLETLWTPGTGHLFIPRYTESDVVSLYSLNLVFLTTF
jgi:hypothetical protein